jgi:predicted nuclease of predicted toxin-antitoxin system
VANENFPAAAVEPPRNLGHDVFWVRTDAPGSTDTVVLSRAQSEARVVITFDKGFGELAFRWGLPAEAGVVLFRIAPTSAAYVADVAVRVLESRSDWAGHFTLSPENTLPDVSPRGQTVLKVAHVPPAQRAARALFQPGADSRPAGRDRLRLCVDNRVSRGMAHPPRLGEAGQADDEVSMAVVVPEHGAGFWARPIPLLAIEEVAGRACLTLGV